MNCITRTLTAWHDVETAAGRWQISSRSTMPVRVVNASHTSVRRPACIRDMHCLIPAMSNLSAQAKCLDIHELPCKAHASGDGHHLQLATLPSRCVQSEQYSPKSMSSAQTGSCQRCLGWWLPGSCREHAICSAAQQQTRKSSLHRHACRSASVTINLTRPEQLNMLQIMRHVLKLKQPTLLLVAGVLLKLGIEMAESADVPVGGRPNVCSNFSLCQASIAARSYGSMFATVPTRM